MLFFARRFIPFNVIMFFIGLIRVGLAFPVDDCELPLAGEASRDFAYDFYKNVLKHGDNSESGNVFLAPTTVETSLTMLHAGAGGQTRLQIWEGLTSSSMRQRMTEDDLLCLNKVNNPEVSMTGGAVHEPKDDEVVFTTVSRLYGEKSFGFRRAFVNYTRELGQKMKKVSFALEPTQSRNRINHWVSKVTNEKIQRLFGRDDITSATKLVIVSAVYFKAPWAESFEPGRPGQFTTTSGEQVQAKYMTQAGMYKTIVSRDIKAALLELPFKSDSEGSISTSMIILLPTGTIGNLEDLLTEQNARNAIARLLQSRVQYTRVEMPKFEISSEYDLKPVLRGMGMNDIFDSANFTRMSRTSSGLYVSAAVHKTYIKVDETGVEATGATGVSIGWRTIPDPFYVRKAFIAIIYNKVSDTILFIGKINDPTATD